MILQRYVKHIFETTFQILSEEEKQCASAHITALRGGPPWHIWWSLLQPRSPGVSVWAYWSKSCAEQSAPQNEIRNVITQYYRRRSQVCFEADTFWVTRNLLVTRSTLHRQILFLSKCSLMIKTCLFMQEPVFTWSERLICECIMQLFSHINFQNLLPRWHDRLLLFTNTPKCRVWLATFICWMRPFCQTQVL